MNVTLLRLGDVINLQAHDKLGSWVIFSPLLHKIFLVGVIIRDDFNTLGSHLSNAKGKYDDSSKRLERFSDKLINIEDSKTIDLK